MYHTAHGELHASSVSRRLSKSQSNDRSVIAGVELEAGLEQICSMHAIHGQSELGAIDSDSKYWHRPGRGLEPECWATSEECAGTEIGNRHQSLSTMKMCNHGDKCCASIPLRQLVAVGPEAREGLGVWATPGPRCLHCHRPIIHDAKWQTNPPYRLQLAFYTVGRVRSLVQRSVEVWSNCYQLPAFARTVR